MHTRILYAIRIIYDVCMQSHMDRGTLIAATSRILFQKVFTRERIAKKKIHNIHHNHRVNTLYVFMHIHIPFLFFFFSHFFFFLFIQIFIRVWTYIYDTYCIIYTLHVFFSMCVYIYIEVLVRTYTDIYSHRHAPLSRRKAGKRQHTRID